LRVVTGCDSNKFSAQREIEAASAKLYSTKKSSTDVTSDTDGMYEVPPSEARSKPAALIESITALLVQQVIT